ncbi:MAG: hypothetical protein AB9880_07750 [Christensenellales bacterium]
MLVLLAFLLMILSDLLKLARRQGPGKYLFLLGVAVLAAGGVSAASSAARFQVALPIRICSLLISLTAAALEYRALFVCLPACSIYLGNDGQGRLVDSGMYAACRHPGALWFPLFSICLALGLGNWELLTAAGLASALNFLYVWIQDRYIFPGTIADYEGYRQTTPYIMPTAGSIRRALGKQSGSEDRR